MNNLDNKFNKAIEDMIIINNYLASEVCKLGYPTLTESIPTAGVAWDEPKKKIIFLFNPIFASGLNDSEMCFVVAHEGMHLMLSHVLFLRDEIEKMKAKNKSTEEINNFIKKMNVAMDCVINDSLINLYHFSKVLYEDSEISNKQKIYYGKDTVGTNCHDMTASEVYSLLPDEVTSNDHESWNSFFNSDGSIKKDFIDSLKGFVEKNIQNSILSDREIQRLEKIKEDLTNSSDVYASKAGKSISSSKRPIDGSSRDTINWNRILYKFIDNLKVEDDWSKPNRKLISSYPNILLPNQKNQEKQKIFVAIDSSGSISKSALTLFVNVLRNTPKRIEIDSISFDTRCYPYDIKSNKMPLGGGGTNFQIIEEYIQKNYTSYPKAIFVLTDGDGSKIYPKYPERWCWLLYDACRTNYCKDMKNYKINDLLEKK